jgi:hypothetical protein
LISLVPIPHDLSHHVACLHSVYTEKNHCQKKYAQKIVDSAIQYFRDNGISHVLLNASDAGKSIYEKAGFVPLPETMSSFIK